MPPFYHGSKGQQDVEQMHLAHLGNAVRKIERMGDADPNYPQLAEIKAVFERRQAAWEAAHPGEDF